MPFNKLKLIIAGKFAHKLQCYIRCEAVVGEFLASIKKAPEKVKFADMINIVITHAQSNDPVVQVSV